MLWLWLLSLWIIAPLFGETLMFRQEPEQSLTYFVTGWVILFVMPVVLPLALIALPIYSRLSSKTRCAANDHRRIHAMHRDAPTLKHWLAD